MIGRFYNYYNDHVKKKHMVCIAQVQNIGKAKFLNVRLALLRD